jgi:hypothetical protein
VASVVSLLVTARSTAGTALRAAERQVSSFGASVSRLTRTLTTQRQTVSSVAGAYRAADGTWRNANGTLIMQRNHLIQIGSRFGTLVHRIGGATSALGRFVRAGARVGGVLGRMGAASAPMAVLTAKIVLLAAAITSLLGITGNLLGATQLLAPTIIAGATAMATFKMATAGVADALKAGIEGDVEKFNEALKKLTPHAQSTVKTLLDLRREWRSTQRAVQDRFFAGFREDAIAVSRSLQPIADKWLPRVAGMFAQTRTVLRSVFTEAARSGQLDKIMEGVSRGIGGLLNVLPPLARALFDVAEVASSAFGDLGAGAQSAAQRFADWIREAKESGKLAEWLQKAIDTLNSLKNIAGNVGEMLGALFRGASDNSQSLLEKIEELTQRMADWLNSSDGQALIDTLSSIVGWVIANKQAFEVMAVVIKTVVAIATASWGLLFDVVKFVINWILAGYSMLLSGAEKAFGWIPGLGPKLKAAKDQFEQWKNGVNNSINGIQKTIDITVRYKAVRIGPHMVSGSQQSGEYSSGIGGRASGGAASGIVRVGERGEEIVDFNRRLVLSNNDPRAAAFGRSLAGGGGAGGAAMTVINIAAAPGAARNPGVAMVLEAFRSGALTLRVQGTNARVAPA